MEHHVPQGSATTGDGPFSAKGSAVMRDRGQSGERGSFFAGDGADLGHFGDQHCARNRADPRDGTQNGGHFRQVIVARDGPDDPVFKLLDQAVDPLRQLGVDVLKYRSSSQFLMRTDLGKQSLAHLDQLGSFRRQRPEKAKLLRWKASACIGAESKEASDEFGVYPVGLCAGATALRKRLYLSGWNLAGYNTFRFQMRPELPLLATSRFKADDGIPVAGKIGYGSMTSRSVWHSASMSIGEAMNVEQVAADVYADNAAM